MDWSKVRDSKRISKNKEIDWEIHLRKLQSKQKKLDSELSRLFDFAESNSKGSKSYGFVLSVKRQVLKTGFLSDKQKAVLLKIANSSTILDLQRNPE